MRDGGGRTEPRRAKSQGLTGTLETPRAEKGGRQKGGVAAETGSHCRDAGVKSDPRKFEYGKTVNGGMGSGGLQEWALVQVDRRSKTVRGEIIGCKERCSSVKGGQMGRESGHGR